MKSGWNVCLVLCDLFIVNVQTLPHHTLPFVWKFSAPCLTVDRYKGRWFEDADVDTLICSLIGRQEPLFIHLRLRHVSLLRRKHAALTGCFYEPRLLCRLCRFH